MSDDWSVDKLDVGAYLARTGYSGPTDPSEATLAALYRAHLGMIRFENLDVFLKGVVHVDLESIQDKIVFRGRGGYCYEQAQLFGAVLERLGFGVERLLARVGPDGGPARPRTHAPHAPRPGRPGRLARRPRLRLLPARPLSLRNNRSDGPQEVDGWTYEVTPDTEHGQDVWKLRENQAGTWVTLHRWDDAKVQPVDVVLSNYYTSTSPDSWFTWQPVIVRRDPDAIWSILGRTYTVTSAGYAKTRRELSDKEFAAALTGEFGLKLTMDELDALVGAPAGTGAGRGRGPGHLRVTAGPGREARTRSDDPGLCLPAAYSAGAAASGAWAGSPCSCSTERSRVKPGSGRATSSAPAMQASPPDTTDAASPKAFATAPASRSPSRGPPATTAICTPISRPRIPSGPANWMIVFRKTAEITSAQPATASSGSAAHSHGTRPNPAIAAPHTMTAKITARPCRRIRPTQPVVTAPISAPDAGCGVQQPDASSRRRRRWSRPARGTAPAAGRTPWRSRRSGTRPGPAGIAARTAAPRSSTAARPAGAPPAPIAGGCGDMASTAEHGPGSVTTLTQ